MDRLKIAWFYDLNACRAPTGVTRHALAQLERLARRPDVLASVVAGRIGVPEGLAYWQSLVDLRKHRLPLSVRDMLRLWRVVPFPVIEHWTGDLDWVYCPAEFFVPTRRALRAVTSHDVLQDVRYGGERRLRAIRKAIVRADLILSVSQFNTQRLLEQFPECRGRVALAPNAAEDLFFESATEAERAGVRQVLGLPEGVRYLVSVANFQERKNLPRLLRAAARLPEIRSGELALVLIGHGFEEETNQIREAGRALGPHALLKMPGYRQGVALRAIYAEALALVFPSLCESFGIPAVEAMAQGLPVAAANSTALPEIAGDAGWYFDPMDEESIAAAVRDLIDQTGERARRMALGSEIAAGYRWDSANDRVVAALRQFSS